MIRQLIISALFFLTIKTFGQTTFRQCSLTDTATFCSGHIKILQIKKPHSRTNDIINKTIRNFVATNTTIDTNKIDNIAKSIHSISEAAIGWNIDFELTTQRTTFYCFHLSMCGTCGSSTSYGSVYPLNIDKLTGKTIKLDDIINQRKEFETFVRDYCKKFRVDNVSYMSEPDSTAHKQNLIEYRLGLDDDFEMTDSTIIVNTKIFDNNIADWLRLSRDAERKIVGEEFMTVAIPTKLIDKFLQRKK
ncbi:MAG: hypothetical protein RJA07_2772 [Bacteroidota bacterium]|jgi:hypothetical protein